MNPNNELKTKTISVQVPINTDDLGFNQTYYQELIAATLYHNGTLKLKQARMLIGKSRREFEEDVLPKFGYTTMKDNPNDVRIELNAANW